MFALILHFVAMQWPSAEGCGDGCGGNDAAPRATSLRISPGSSFSRFAMYSISSVITPCRAKCICDTFLFPFASAAAASAFQSSYRAIP